MTLPAPSRPDIPHAPGLDPRAKRHAPILMLDLNEPAPPLAMGVTILETAGPSPSSKFQIVPPPGGAVIEYAIWHDWDIQHLYDLEQVWVHVSADGDVLRVEGSMHGMRVCADSGSGLPEMRDGRPVLYLEPGKHAIWPAPGAMRFVAGAMIVEACGAAAGAGAVHTGNHFAETKLYRPDRRHHRLARLALRRASFAPSFRFAPAPEVAIVPWGALEAWIPVRVTALLDALPVEVPHLAAVLLDCGDTLIDERTEVKRPGTEVVEKADAIPFAIEAVQSLWGAGHRLALVADGPRETFENLLQPRGVWDLMEAHIISEDIGVLKPAPEMFTAAMTALDLPGEAAGRVVMVGNNLARDIRGARAFGMMSVHVAWSTLRAHRPSGPEEEPDRVISRLEDLVPTIETLELAL